MPIPSLIGARVRRKEDPRLITGAAKYTGDIQLPGMYHVAFVRSPYAHARILNIDASGALKMPGVLAVVTGTDVPALCNPMPEIGTGEGSDGRERRSEERRVGEECRSRWSP